jgi:hypothetical protein
MLVESFKTLVAVGWDNEAIRNFSNPDQVACCVASAVAHRCQPWLAAPDKHRDTLTALNKMSSAHKECIRTYISEGFTFNEDLWEKRLHEIENTMADCP